MQFVLDLAAAVRSKVAYLPNTRDVGLVDCLDGDRFGAYLDDFVIKLGCRT